MKTCKATCNLWADCTRKHLNRKGAVCSFYNDSIPRRRVERVLRELEVNNPLPPEDDISFWTSGLHYGLKTIRRKLLAKREGK